MLLETNTGMMQNDVIVSSFIFGAHGIPRVRTGLDRETDTSRRKLSERHRDRDRDRHSPLSTSLVSLLLLSLSVLSPYSLFIVV